VPKSQQGKGKFASPWTEGDSEPSEAKSDGAHAAMDGGTYSLRRMIVPIA
jgi:hypothetical protein